MTIHSQKINSTGVMQLITKNSYDELGNLISKNVGGTDVVNYTGLQQVNYSYNVRGWMTGINDVSNLVQASQPKDLFAFKINYNSVQDETNYTGRKMYNGNISETYWKTANDDVLRKYGYEYDDLNRLKKAIFQKPGSTTVVTNSYNESMTYDKNGNIMMLTRNGDYDDMDFHIDDLNYTYINDSNRLMKVTDTTNCTSGFKDDSNGYNDTQDDYRYDNYGNMDKDDNKGITDIKYNHLNLPILITFGTLGTIEYVYTAEGEKLEKTVTENGTPTIITTTKYLDGFQYVNNELNFFPHAEGYVTKTSSKYNYIFNFTDHLGNVRLTYSDLDKDGVLETDEKIVECSGSNCITYFTSSILKENNYYPFGLEHGGYNDNNGQPYDYRYRFNQKEWQDELGLNWYDYGNRGEMSDIGRWGTMDSKAEFYFNSSPYVYASNTPVNAIDPDGNIVIFINGQHGGTGGSADYWRNYTGRETNFMSMSNRQAFDISVMNKLGDHKPLYRDGAMGGWDNTLWETNFSKSNVFSSSRINSGYDQGKADAKWIIDHLARDKTTGEIVETIKIITHSMGGAYGKGYVKALKDYIKTLPKELQYQVRITLVADFDPFQAGSLTADSEIKTQQFKHKGDGNILGMGWLANENEKGLDSKDIYTNTGISTDHSIMTFFNDIRELTEGTYKKVNGKWVKQ